jgi:hypothetical protein
MHLEGSIYMCCDANQIYMCESINLAEKIFHIMEEYCLVDKITTVACISTGYNPRGKVFLHLTKQTENLELR